MPSVSLHRDDDASSCLSEMPLTGVKVVLKTAPEAGFGEVAAPVQGQAKRNAAFYTTPTRHVLRSFQLSECARTELALQTRCYFLENGVYRNGRIIGPPDRMRPVWVYPVQFPATDAGPVVRLLAETDFKVRSGLPTGDPTETLAECAHETPFFFEYRSKWISNYVQQVRYAGGLTGPLSGPVDLFPHQAEVVGRVLRDPEVRYLLADEVGLGKTVEAGLIVRQLRLDAPQARIAICVPESLVRQWIEELTRLGLADIRVITHAQLAITPGKMDIVLIDEAHRVVADRDWFEGARKLCSQTRHVLLLSATPVLHNEAEMLSLLHLLAPDAYRLEDFEAFRDRVRLRRDLGRVLLAMSTASSALVLKAQIKRVAELLPNDPVAASGKLLIENNVTTEAVRAEAAAIHTHVSETYRLYRRMLRSRRSALVADGSVVAERRFHPPTVANAATWSEVWGLLDEWRVVLAAEQPTSDAAAFDFLRIGRAVATDPELACETITARLKMAVSAAEQRALRRLREALDGAAVALSRIDNLIQLLASWKLGDGKDCRKYVVFCDEPRVCNRIAQACSASALGFGVAVAHAHLADGEFSGAVNRFRDDSTCNILVADRTAEEGLNLTYAHRVVMFDLPFEPLRLEQRLGRLDRLTRIEDVHIHVILTHPDQTVGLDAAWLHVLAAGFGVLSRSASDVQIVIHRETVRLRMVAFTGGAVALAQEAPAVAVAVAAERLEADEQDAIDGLQLGTSASGTAYRGLRAADRAAGDFGEAIRGYWRDPLRLEVRQIRPNVVEYTSRGPKTPPLLPLDRFLSFQHLTNRPSTVHRGAALARPGLQFVRPGHPFADALWRLAEWDDRGRAFAMWRQMPGQTEPRFVFRVAVLTGLELPQLTDSLTSAGYDDLAKANLLRLVGLWFQPRYDEVFLDEGGEVAPDRHVAYCKENYDSDIDRNLSDDASRVLTRLFGEDTWPTLCRRARDAAIEALTQSEAFRRDQAQALAAATEHFRVVRARLRARVGAAESSTAIEAAVAAEDRLEAVVLELIRAPLRTCDSIGFYVLSDAPPESTIRD